MLRSLALAVEEAASDDSILAVALTGAGASFCSGADTSELAGGSGEGPHKPGEGGPEALRRGFRDPHRVILGLYNMEKPVVAAIEGVAAGAGLDLACACDIRIAAASSRFSAAYVKVGLFPGYGGTWFYPRLVGTGRAMELALTGDFIDAGTAERAGLVNRVVADGSARAEAEALAARLAAGPPVAIRLAKLMMRRGAQMDLETALQMAAAAESITLSSEDHAEGMAAMREKRRPRFMGR
jgi:enoyl-CoA hydratase/carnithine racemase